MISTARSTGNQLAVRRVVDIAKKIDVLEPDAAPLTQLTKKIEKKVAVNPDFKWMEEESLTKQGAAAATITAGITQVSVATGQGARFRAGDVVKVVATGEQLLVTGVSTDTLDISRGWGTTSAGSIAADGVLLIVGNANEEHATKRTFKIGDQSEKTNYTQIFRTPFGESETSANSEYYGGKDRKHIRMMQLIEHQKEIERAFWFGEPKVDTTGTHYRRATGGVDYWVSTNASDASGTLTEAEFETFLRTGFRYGSKTKWLFAAPLIVSAINSWAKDNIRIVPKDKTFGVSVAQWLSPFGMVNIVLDNLFAETTTYSGYAYLIDPEQLMYRYLANRDTRLKTNIQANDADGWEDEYISEVGLHFSQEKKAAVLYNVTSFT